MNKKLFRAGIIALLCLCSCGENENRGDSRNDWGTSSSVDPAVYRIRFENYDGTLLKTCSVLEGETPEYDGKTPTKSGDAHYTYTFSGWQPSLSPAYNDQTYVATFSDETNAYSITWEDYDGTVLRVDYVLYGETPSYGEDPVREGDAQYSYAFSNWEPSVERVTGDATYKAVYADTTNEYQITWENYDGTILRVDSVAYGETPSYGEDPVREGDAQYSYAFSNWEPSVEGVTGDATYKAVYTNTTNQYAITWKNYDGTTLRVDSVPYGETPSYGGVPEKDEYAGPYDCYVFDGWYPEVGEVVSSATYTATYSKQACTEFTIRFDANGGAFASWTPTSQKKKKGEPLELDVDAPSREGYLFYGWNNLYDDTVYQDGDEFNADINLTMYAMWAPACSLCGGHGYIKDNTCPKCEGKCYFCPYCNEPLVKRYEDIGNYSFGYCSSCGKQVYENGKNADGSRTFFDEKTMCTNCQGTGYVGTVGECDKYEREAAPAVSEKGARSVTLKEKSGYEYWMSGRGWQSSNVFYDLHPHTSYTFRQRRATSGGVPFGVYSKDLTVTTMTPSTYYVTYKLDGGENDSRNPAAYKTSVTSTPLYAPTKEGYSFAGWSYRGEIVSEIKGSWKEDITLVAKWTPVSYAITYDLQGGTNASSNLDEYTIESEDISFSDPTKSGYSFDGWYSDADYSDEVDGIASGSTGDMSLYAKWSANKNNLSVTSSDESMGSVSVSGEGYTDEEITVTATPAEGYAFKGWYRGETLVSRANLYTFTMPSNDLSLEARFMTKTEERQALGIDPVIDSENKTLTYGLYPQTRVSDEATLASLNALTTAESNDWYLLNGEYYAKKSADTHADGFVFDDGMPIVDGTEYWFKCEPITWKILSSSNGEHSLVSTVLLDAHRYNASWYGKESKPYYANNYCNSEIRAWLNDYFYKHAFSLDDSLIQTTTVDNSASTTSSTSNKYACSNTNDKVFLLSDKDYANTTYFADSAARLCKPTDWARANGAYYSKSSSYLYNGLYWTRSPGSSEFRYAGNVSYNGNVGRYTVDSSYISVRPAITIKVAQ